MAFSLKDGSGSDDPDVYDSSGSYDPNGTVAVPFAFPFFLLTVTGFGSVAPTGGSSCSA